MSKHTQGIWEVFESDVSPPYVYTNGDQRNTISVSGGNPEERLANANLIAAAPELLKTLKAMVVSLRAMAQINSISDEVSSSLFDQALEVIAKAEGRDK